ncbi:MAG TPA: hypothetical protein VMD79_01100 [Solirubrobacteraceae bacterium]|nr:hypothetical protein [Solirubrobacteraceae bacterium]
MSFAGPRTRPRVALALLTALLALAFAASTARAEPWGKITSFPLGNPKPLFENEDGRAGPVKFAAGSDGSYYLLLEEKKKLVLQRFDAQEEEEQRQKHGTTKFSPQAEISFKPPPGEEEEEGKAILVVDPSRDRVYVLVVSERPEQSEKEKTEEKDTGKPVFPLDEDMPAASALYAFEYNESKKELVSSKEKEGKKGAKEAAPLLTEAELKTQSEKPGEALLDPRGIAVEPKTGDLAISGNQDDEPNDKVEEYEESKHAKGEQKQCRAAVQFVTVKPSEGKITGLSLGARYVDTNGEILFGKTGCGGREEEEGVDQAPASPAFAPNGSLLAYGEDTEVAVETRAEEDEEAEGIIWQLTPAEADAHPAEEVTMTGGTKTNEAPKPKELFVASSVPAFYPEVGEAEEPASVMSIVPEAKSETEGTIYVSGYGNELLGVGDQPTLLVLHYSDDDGTPSVSEVGWTAGGEPEKETLSAGPCNLHKPRTKPIMVGGLATSGSKRAVLAFTYYHEWVDGTIEEPAAEVVEFGEGSASSTKCPQVPVTKPTQEYLGAETSTLPAGAELNVTSFLGTPDTLAASPKSAKWTVKYSGESKPKEIEEHYEYNGLHEVLPGYGEELGLKLGPAQPGDYEISVEVDTDDLADEVVKSEVDKVTVPEAKKLLVEAEVPVPHEVLANEEEATLKAKAEIPGEKSLDVTKVVWDFGDKTPQVEYSPHEPLANPATLEVKHAFNRCDATGKLPTKCKIEVKVEAEDAEHQLLTATGHPEITVKENKAEEAQEEKEKKEKKEKEEKEEKEKKEKKEKEEKEAKEAKEAKEKAEREAAEKEAKEKAEREAKGGVAGYVASFTGSSLTVSEQGATSVSITCPSGGSCSGTLTLQTLNAVAVSGGKHAKKEVLTLTSGGFSLSGGSKSVTLHLNSTALALLRRFHGVLRVKLTILSHGTAGRSNSSTTHVITVRLVQNHNKHHGKR